MPDVSYSFVSLLRSANTTPQQIDISSPQTDYSLSVRRVMIKCATPIAVLREIATDYIVDNVGKNNYVSTIDSECQLNEYPIGTYVMRWGNDSHSKINIWVVKPSGWFGSVTPWFIGYFECVPTTIRVPTEVAAPTNAVESLQRQLNSLQRENRSLREEASYAVRTHATPVLLANSTAEYSAVIEELKALGKSKLRTGFLSNLV